jgi:hypothetical protein
MAKTDDWLALRVGPLTLLMRINKEGRFPQIKDVIPRHGRPPATLELADADAAFLADAVKRCAGRLTARATCSAAERPHDF